MAPIESPLSSPNRRALAGWPNALAALYVLLVFVALRALDDNARLLVLGAAALTYAAMIVGRLRGRFAADADGKKLLLLVVGPADALLLLGGALCTWFTLGDASTLGEGNREIVVGAGVLSLVAGAAIAFALEVVSEPMRATGTIDNRRVQTAARTAATLVLAIAALVAVVFGVEKLDVRRDFSFGAPTTPSAATVSMLEASSCPAAMPPPAAPGPDAGPAEVAPAPPAGPTGKAEVFLFFERGSTSLAEVRDYFDALERKGARITTLDAAYDPTLAKDMKVSKNGTVGFRCGQRTESWTLGDTREDAQKKLNKLDEEIRTRLAKISKDPATVYVTVGHGERSLEEAAKGGARVSAKGLKKLVESLNAKTKKLGLADGLSKDVPSEAALVIIAGPTSAFLPDEADALARYVSGGGSLLLLLDPKLPDPDAQDVHGSLEPLLAALAVRVGSHEVMNDKAYVKNSKTSADFAFLYSTSFGNHKSVKTLSGARGKAALLFMGAGTVDKRSDGAKDAPKAATAPKVSLVARTPAASWVDADDDRAFDDGQEARAIVDLAGAVEIPPANEGGKEGRAMVVGDSDVLADLLVAQDANSMFAYETLLWLLRDDDKLGSAVASEEDVAIRHTRDEDTVWFYGTILFGPALCLIGGLVFVTRKRRRRVQVAVPAASPPAGGAA